MLHIAIERLSWFLFIFPLNAQVVMFFCLNQVYIALITFYIQFYILLSGLTKIFASYHSVNLFLKNQCIIL